MYKNKSKILHSYKRSEQSHSLAKSSKEIVQILLVELERSMNIVADKLENKGNEQSKNDIEIKSITTKGDQVQNTRLSDIGGKGLFSTEIEKELENKTIDIAVHALKDMPVIETSGLKTVSFLERNDPREILITNDKKKFNDLKLRSIVGTSSFRREFQIKKLRSDLTVSYTHLTLPTTVRV